MKNQTIGLYAGSFDPITKGHLDIVEKALATFDVVHIAVGINPSKSGMFSTEDRLRLISESVNEKWPNINLNERVKVGSWSGKSVTKYAAELGCTHLIRGLRQSSDFDDEFRYHGVCERIGDLTMDHFICKERFLHVSSSTARELAALNEDTSWLVMPCVEKALCQRLAS